MPVTVARDTSHTVIFFSERKPESPEETHDFRQRVDSTLCTRGLSSSHIENPLLGIYGLTGTRKVVFGTNALDWSLFSQR